MMIIVFLLEQVVDMLSGKSLMGFVMKNIRIALFINKI